MGNRKQPFGYKIAFGEVVVQPEEAKVVQKIFEQYLMGESLKRLADILQEQAVAYDDGRLWNKNIIARILADDRYTGEKGYPKLIEPELLLAVTERRVQKAAPPQKTEMQKMLRKLCKKTVSNSVERQVAELLNGLIQTPALIQQPPQGNYQKAFGAQDKLDKALD